MKFLIFLELILHVFKDQPKVKFSCRYKPIYLYNGIHINQFLWKNELKHFANYLTFNGDIKHELFAWGQDKFQ